MIEYGVVAAVAYLFLVYLSDPASFNCSLGEDYNRVRKEMMR
jgi:hypothetical protein